ncbi:hypothetical protein SAMD00019534_072780 [Acytostelium subglobosum LB1]|uniref:hypothetical protein n=1 Tax=Acytostelium subglobosum LB1 TaxID=1410327 RepID=UPI00064504DE|nr:hypothetical protein SAMD00019534_072780 [Acytostelium subglobosum LB1]GAM24103.1 hypothetical protein SAMD00019534_072780 [Acytostelium subglobosum LB1]|eukprot:XP_012753139.1 hypothetical protein SAMD00019534_072780 [Acytostelium subglobosum LB1]
MMPPPPPPEEHHYVGRWSILHSKMKSIPDSLGQKRGSILIEHMPDIHKLTSSQIITTIREEPASPVDDASDNSSMGGAGSGNGHTVVVAATDHGSGSPRQPSDGLVFTGIKMFNDKPKRGVDFFVGIHLLEKTPASISEFLHTCTLLNKRSIGDYLGESDQFCIDTLEAFIARFNFQDLDFDMALRQLLYCFRLPGEAQKIDRIMLRFANQFYKDNIKSGIFEDPDAVYILAFAIIMLNTDLHSPSIKSTLTKQRFIRSLTGINNGKDLQLEYLEDLYDRILSDEIKLDPSQAQFPYAVKKGWLYIRSKGKVTDKWSKKWCILNDGSLYFFRKPTDTIPIRYLHPTVITQQGKEVKGRKNCFMLNHSSQFTELIHHTKQFTVKSLAALQREQRPIYEKLAQRDQARPAYFWDSLLMSMDGGGGIGTGVRLEAVDDLDTESISSLDTISEHSAPSSYYDEDTGSISSSPFDSSPFSSSVPQPHVQYLNIRDPKKKGFSLKIGKERKQDTSHSHSSSTTTSSGNSTHVQSSPMHTPPTTSGVLTPSSSSSSTRPHSTHYSGRPLGIIRTSSFQSLTPSSNNHSNSSSASGTPNMAPPVLVTPPPPIDLLGTNDPRDISANNSNSNNNNNIDYHLKQLQIKMSKSAKKHSTCLLLSTDTRREMESWTRLIITQFQKQQQPPRVIPTA